MRKNLARRPKNRLRLGTIRPNNRLPNTHVPVVVCRSAGIWTRGQSTALGRPAAGGKPAHPAQRGTRLEATTDRAFLVSADPPKVGLPKRLVYLAGRAEGKSPFQTMALNPKSASGILGHGAASGPRRAGATAVSPERRSD